MADESTTSSAAIERRLRIFFRDGRIALVVGVRFLFVCIARGN